MTVQEMHLAVKLGLDKTSNFALPSLLPEELDYWLNEGYMQLIKQKIFGNNYRRENYETGAKRVNELAPLIKMPPAISSFKPNYKYSNVYTPYPGSQLDDVQDFMYLISAKCVYTSLDAHKPGYATLVPITAIGNLVQTEYNMPFLRHPYVYLDEDGFNFILDPSKVLSSVEITYFKRPLKLTSGTPAQGETDVPEVTEEMHSEIVALTVNLLLENLESPRSQTNELQLSRKE